MMGKALSGELSFPCDRSCLWQGQTWENANFLSIVHFDLEIQSTLMALNSRGHLVTLG